MRVCVFIFSFFFLATIAKADSPEVQQACQTMLKAVAFMESISTEGGFVWNYMPDLSRRAGESICPATVTWNESPGTAAVGRAFLRAWKATNDVQFLNAARRAAIALGRCQLPSGGWHYSGSFDPALPNKDGAPDYKGAAEALRKPGEEIYPLHKMATTFDDGVTQNSVQFLIEYVAATKGLNDASDEPARQTLDRALAGMLRAQYPNGAWPERYFGEARKPEDFPVQKAQITDDWTHQWSPETEADYVHHYTLNDGCQRDCIETMLLGWKLLGRKDCLDSAKRGGDFLILAQFPEPQAGWAGIYDFQMRPAWGRVFEPPGLASNESRTAMEALLELYLETGEEKYLKPLSPALDWLERSKIGPNLWSRLYELGANKPIYGDRDGKIHYDLEEISRERRQGYGWQGDYRIPEFIAQYQKITNAGRDAILEARKPMPPAEKEIAKRRRDANAAIASLDKDGRWLVRGKLTKDSPELEEMISTAEFIRNMNRISSYLQCVADAAKAGQQPPP